MKFRPCIDLHAGQVKQIVGSTLQSTNHQQEDNNESNTIPALATNFSTSKPASAFAQTYQTDALTGGHVIMLGKGNQDAALEAVRAYPGGLQVGGGIQSIQQAQMWLDAGASHVIITSYVFSKGQLHRERLQQLAKAIGKDKLVLDLSCRKRPKSTSESSTDRCDRDNPYFVVTDQWQVFSNLAVTKETLVDLAQYCGEFLVHGVDVEGLQCGILDDLVALLALSPIPVTYAGGVRSLDDLTKVERLGNGHVDCTVGSALDLFGGPLPYADVVAWHRERNAGAPE